MKIIVLLSIFSLFLSNFCFADGLPISDVIKEARDKASVSETVNTAEKDKTSNLDKTQVSKQEVKDNVTETLDDLKEVN